jgi:hypothetical protein
MRMNSRVRLFFTVLLQINAKIINVLKLIVSYTIPRSLNSEKQTTHHFSQFDPVTTPSHTPVQRTTQLKWDLSCMICVSLHFV